MSSKATATFALAAVLKGGSKSVFKAISAGLKDIGKELTNTAKDMHKMGKIDAADAVGHVADAFKRLDSQIQQYNKGGKKAGKTAKEITTPMKDMKKEVQAVNDAWKFFSKNETATGTALQNAGKWTKQTANAIHNLDQQMRQAGADTKDWAKKVKWSNIQEGLRTNALKLTGNQFQIMNAKGREALGLNNKLGKSLDNYNKRQDIYNKELTRSIGINKQYRAAVVSLGRATQFENEQAKIWAPTLRRVHTAMEKSRAGMRGMSTEMKSWTKNSNLASVTQSVLAGNLRVTAKGFQIMNEKGLKDLSGLSYSAAEGMGMLSKGFAQLSVREGSSSLTAFGRALSESGQRSVKFQQSLEKLAKSGVGVGKAFQARYEDMKKSDDMFRKHTASLHQSGKITTETMHKMNASFNASKVASKDLANALSAPEKRMQSLKGVIATVHQETGKSVASIKKLAGEYYKSSKGVGSMAERLELVKAKLQAQIPAQRNLIKAHQDLTSLEQKASKITGKSISEIQKKTRARVDEARSVSETKLAVDKSIASLTKEMGAIKSSAKGKKAAGKAIRNLNVDYGHLLKTHPDYVKGLKAIADGYRKSETAGRIAAKSTREWAKSTGPAKEQASLFSRAILSLNSHLKSFASYAAAASIIAGFVQSLRAAAAAVIDFDQSLKDLQAITSATDREVGVMGEKIKSVASTTKFSAQEVAQGMKTLGQAGLSASESVQTMQAVSDLATGTLTDMSTSVDLVTTAMRVFNIGATDSGHVADVFANAVNRSKLTVEKLRIAMNYVGPVAARAGVSFEEVASSMMSLANSGIRASTIGTGLRQVFRKLVDPSKELKAAVESVGMTMDDLNPKYHSMRDIIENLSEVVVTAEDAFTMFGMRGASAISALTAQGTKGFDKMWKSVNRSGSAAEMAAKQMEGLAVKIKNMFDKAKNLAIALGENGLSFAMHLLIDASRHLLDLMTKLTESFAGSLILQITATTVAIATLIATFRAFQTFGFVTEFFGTFHGMIRNIPKKVAAATISLNSYSVATTGAAAATGSLTSALWAATLAFAGTGIGAVVITIGSLITALGGLVLWQKRANKSQQKAIDEAENLTDTYSDQVKSVTKLNIRLASLKKGSDTYAGALRDMHAKLLDVAKGETALADAAAIALRSIDPLKGVLYDSGEALKAYADAAEKLELEKMSESFALVSEQLKGMYGPLNRFLILLKKLGDQVKLAGKFLIDDLVLPFQMVGTAIQKVSDKLDNFSPKLVKFIKAIHPLAKGLERLKKFTGGGDESVALLDSFNAGAITFSELVEKAGKFNKDATPGMIALRKAITKVQVKAGELLVKMDALGEITLDMSADDIVKRAEEMGLLTGEIELQKKALFGLAQEKQKAAREFAKSPAEKLARDFEKEWGRYDELIAKEKKGIDSVSEALQNLSKERIEEQRIAEKSIADRINAVKKKMAEDPGYLRQGVDDIKKLNAEYSELRKADSKDVVLQQKKQLLLIAETREKELAIHKAKFSRQKQVTVESLTELIAIEEKYAKQAEEIMLGTFDMQALKNKMDLYTATIKAGLSEQLQEIALAAAQDTRGESRGVYADAAAKAKVDALQKLEDRSDEYLQHIRETKGIESKEDEEWTTKHLKRVKDRNAAEIQQQIVMARSRKQASSVRIAEAEAENRKLGQIADAQMAQLEGQIAARTISSSQAATEARDIQRKTIEEQIRNLEKAAKAEGVVAEDASKTMDKLNALSIKHTRLVNEEMAAANDTAEAISNLNRERRAIQLESAANSIEMGIGITPGIDAEFEKAKALLAIHKEEAALKVQQAEEKNAEVADSGDMKEMLAAENALASAKEAARMADLEGTRAVIAEKVSLYEKMWRQGIVSGQEYADTVRAGIQAGVVDYEEGARQITLASGNMFDALKMGWNDALAAAKTCTEIMVEVGNYAAEALADGFTNAWFEFIDGTKSASEAFSDMAKTILQDIARMMMRMAMLNMMKSAFGATSFGSFLGFKDGGQVLPAEVSGVQAADGGLIGGYSPHDKADNIPAMLTAKEFVEPVDAVKYYGVEVFEALRRKLIPKEFFDMAKGVAVNSLSPANASKTNYATGGLVGSRDAGNASGIDSFSVSVPVSLNGITNAEGLIGVLQQGIENTVISILRQELR